MENCPVSPQYFLLSYLRGWISRGKEGGEFQKSCGRLKENYELSDHSLNLTGRTRLDQGTN